MRTRAFVMLSVVALAGAGCGDDVPPRPVIDAPAPGTARFAWKLRLLTDRTVALSCAQIGADFVQIDLRASDGTHPPQDHFDCASETGSLVVPPGTYSASFTLTGPNLTPVAAVEIPSVTLLPGDDKTVDAVTFAVDATGGLSLGLTTGAAHHCAANGGPITGFKITLDRPDGICDGGRVFQRMVGTTQVGTYTVNCGNPTTSSCIEVGERLVVPAMPSGTYQVHVHGLLNNVECWKNDNPLPVPAQGKVFSDNLSLVFLGPSRDCP